MMKDQIDLLLVEDEHDLGTVFSRYLRNKGIDVRWENSLKGGWEAYQSLSVKLLIIDVQLLDGNGFDLAQKIMEINPNQPIFFLTALHERSSRLKGLSIGAVDYIVKPFDMDEICLKIRNLLTVSSVAEKQTTSVQELHIGDLLLNMEHYNLRDPQGAVQKLTIREAQLLYHFILHKNGLVYKKDLLLKFWGNTDFFNGKSLEVFISRLRKILQVDSRLHIESIYGAGYILHERLKL